MKKVLVIVAAISIFFFSVVVFSPVLADGGTGIWKNTQCAAGSDSGGPVKPCDLCDALVVIRNIINYLTEIGLAIAALLIAYGAIRLMLAGGSEEYISKAKKTMVLAVTSLAFILGAWLIVNTVLHFLVPEKDNRYFPWQSITCTTAAIPPEQLKEPPPPVVSKTYAIVAADGKYACSPTNSSSCDDVKNFGCSNTSCLQIDASLCGTDYRLKRPVWGFKFQNNSPYQCFADQEACQANQPPNAFEICKQVYTSYGSPSGPGTVSTVCEVPALTPLSGEALQLENSSNRVLWFSSNANVNKNLIKLQQEFNKMNDELKKIGASATVTSAYRPLAYQQHLYEIWDRWANYNLKDNTLPACDNLASLVQNEYSKHQLRSVVNSPNGCAPHVKGTGIDVQLNGIKYEDINSFLQQKNIDLSWQGIPGDEVHFNLKNPPFTGCVQ